MSEPAGTPLPGSYRWALVAAVIVGFQVAFSAGFDLNAALNHDAPPSLTGSESAFPNLGLSPVAQQRIVLATASAYQTVLEAMLPWRIATSALLTLMAGLVFILGMRLRVTEEGRGTIAVQLGSAALAAAVMRSIDGAQSLVFTRTMALEASKAFVREGLPDAEVVAAAGTFVVTAGSGAWTLLMVAGFVTLGNYFRSEALRTALARVEP